MAKRPGKRPKGGGEGRGRPTKKHALKRKGGGKGVSAGGKGKGRGRKKVGKAAGGSKGRGKGLKNGAKKALKGSAAKGAGKGKGKGASVPQDDDERKRGKKRTAEGKGKAVAEDAEEEQDGKKAGKLKKKLNPKKQRRKEVTALYSELINPGRERKGDAVVADIMALLQQRTTPLSEYCLKDIGSRVVQACLKWGSKEQRKQLLTSLRESIPQLAMNRYGHVVVLKLLRYVALTSKERKPTPEERKARNQNLRELLDPIRGKHLHAIFYHRQGCRVINGIYYSAAVDPKEKRRLFHEVAVPQSVALRRPELPGSKPLRQLLRSEDLTAEQRTAMLDHLQEATSKAVEKELLGVDIVHLLFQAYCEVATEAQLKELAEKCMAGAPYLLSSKPGAEAVLRLLGVATAKQRKAFCRDLKGKFAALAMNSVDYLVVLRLATTTDDTVMLSKSMIAEWTKDELAAMCFDKYGHRVLAWMLCPGDAKLFSPYELECLALPAPTALKAADTRRQELLRTLRPLVRAALLRDPLKAAADVSAKAVLTSYLATDWDGELIEALLKACEKAATQEDFGPLGSGTATTTLLVLFRLEPEKADSPLAMPLWRRCLQPTLIAATTSRCAFLVLGMLKHGGDIGAAVAAEFRRRRKEVDTAVNAAEARGAVVKGARTLLGALDEVGAVK